MSEQTPQTEDTLLEFPCELAVKAMGETQYGLDEIVVDIVRRHVDEIREGAVSTRQSSGGKYTSVSVVIRATSKLQLDAIYRDLSGHELIKYVL